MNCSCLVPSILSGLKGNIGVDENGPVVFSKERTQELFDNKKIDKGQYDEAMKKLEKFENEQNPEVEKSTKKKGFWQKIIDFFKVPEGKEKESMDVAVAQWGYDNIMF